jgi:hypothetical protein
MDNNGKAIFPSLRHSHGISDADPGSWGKRGRFTLKFTVNFKDVCNYKKFTVNFKDVFTKGRGPLDPRLI